MQRRETAHEARAHQLRSATSVTGPRSRQPAALRARDHLPSVTVPERCPAKLCPKAPVVPRREVTPSGAPRQERTSKTARRTYEAPARVVREYLHDVGTIEPAAHRLVCSTYGCTRPAGVRHPIESEPVEAAATPHRLDLAPRRSSCAASPQSTLRRPPASPETDGPGVWLGRLPPGVPPSATATC